MPVLVPDVNAATDREMGSGHAAPSTLELLYTQGAWQQASWFRALRGMDAGLAKLDTVLLMVFVAGSALLATAGFACRMFGVAGSGFFDIIPRYFTVGVGMLGAALATRSGGHIAIDLLSRSLSPRTARWVRLAADVIASVVAGILAVVCWDHVVLEWQAESKVLEVLPSWLPVLLLPWGFALTSFRFALRAAQLSPWALLLIPSVGMGLTQLYAVPSDAGMLFGMVAVGLSILLGAPLFTILGAATLLLVSHGGDAELAVISVNMYQLTEAPSLVTLPLFTLLGAILAHGRAPQRLVRFAQAALGWMPGGLLIATVCICAFFTTFTGASGVTIIALGALLHHLLKADGYHDKLSIGVITASGSIGLLFAPALPLIIYGVVAKIDIDKIFIAGILPGLLLIVAVGGAAIWMGHRGGISLPRHAFKWSEARAAARGAVWELMLPVVVLGIFLGGYGTVVEAAAVGVLYGIAVSVFVHRDVSWRELPSLCTQSAALIGAVLIILGVALAFTGYLVDAEIPQQLVEFASSHIHSRWAFLLAVNGLLLVVGCLLDIFSAIIIFVPLLMPVAEVFQVDPIHLGIIFLANLELGYLTPPVGMNLFLSAYRFDKSLGEICKNVAPFLLVLGVVLMIITYVPSLSLALLNIF